ncbi:chondroitinase family polysaccharide lyase [Rubellicoccus peritrichatus]|uniref:Chondroitinase family polysaccharide lyase n=1 Tax=Rubellicoccus peritrichatus TaxID=3080537 RepID=A0AAQ3QVG8_9BACT|nr:chondroitinase family polysaccharide lyase [Puniceicoccus sp. CR14]WOO43411.1 chondroitinase family polysaccharide lyase [Puniceicoccus sp. CR14]
MKRSYDLSQNLLIFTFCFLASLVRSEADQTSIPLALDESLLSERISVTDGDISLSYRHLSDGAPSLRWDYEPGGTLVIHGRIGWKSQAVEKMVEVEGVDYPWLSEPLGFSMRVCRDDEVTEPDAQKLTVAFGSGDQRDCWFNCYPKRRGWSIVHAIYGWETRGEPSTEMDWVKFTAPHVAGTLYLNDIITCGPLFEASTLPNPERRVFGPYQPARIGEVGSLLVSNRRITGIEEAQPFFKNRAITPLPQKVTEEEIEAFRTIEDRLFPILKEKATKPLSAEKMKELEAEFNKFGITRNGDTINGNPIEYKESYGYCKLMRALGDAWHMTSDHNQQKQISDWFLDMFDYAVKLGDIPSRWYNGRGFVDGCFLMRDVLKKNGQLEEAITYTRQAYLFNQLYDDTGFNGTNVKGADLDYLYTCTVSVMSNILMMDESPEKVRDMREISHFYSTVALDYSPSIADGIKPDGSAFHHNMASARGYGNYTIPIVIEALVYPLSGTVFRITEAAHERLRKLAKQRFFYRTQNHIPLGWRNITLGVHRKDASYKENLFLAKSGTPDGKKKYDDEMAAIYLRIVQNDLYYKDRANDPAIKDILSRGIKPADIPQGTKIYPYTAAAIHRRSDWMFAVSGHSSYMFGRECWGYGIPWMYLRWGLTEVIYPDRKDLEMVNSGFSPDGWDWAHLPGVTAPVREEERLKTVITKRGHDIAEHLYSDQPFVGGVSTRHGNGLFVLKLRGHDKYKLDSFYANKTWFMFGDLIICLGTDIRYDISGESVDTTLFQNRFTPNKDSLWIGEKEVDTFPMKWSEETKSPLWMIDNRAVGYYIPTPTNLSLHIDEQTSGYSFVPGRQDAPDLESQGDFALAKIEHGETPDDASYQYAMKIRTNPDAMADFAASMESSHKPYKVLKADSEAHVIHHDESNSMAYVMFQRDYDLNIGHVIGVTKPCTFIVQEKDTGLEVSLSDPDLHFFYGFGWDVQLDRSRKQMVSYAEPWYYEPSKPSVVRLILKGEYELTDDIGSAEILSSGNGQTVLEFVCVDGLSKVAQLQAK